MTNIVTNYWSIIAYIVPTAFPRIAMVNPAFVVSSTQAVFNTNLAFSFLVIIAF